MSRSAIAERDRSPSPKSPQSSSPFNLTPSSAKIPDKKSSLEQLKKSSRVRGSIFKESPQPKKQAKTEPKIARADSKASLRTSRRLRGPRSQEDEKDVQRKSVQFDAEPRVRTFIPPTPDPGMSPVHEPNFQHFSDSSDDELPYISPETLRPLPQVPGRKLPTVPMTKQEIQMLGMRSSKEEKANLIMLHAQSKKASEATDLSVANALGISMQDVGSLSVPLPQSPQNMERTPTTGSVSVKEENTYGTSASGYSQSDSPAKVETKPWITREDVRRRARERREARSTDVHVGPSELELEDKPRLAVDTSSIYPLAIEENALAASGNDVDEVNLDPASDRGELKRLILLPEISPTAGSLSDGLGLQQYFMSASPEARSPSDWAQRQIHSGNRAMFPSSPTSIPQKFATVRAPGAKLKVRPSLSPADTHQMAETRRKISGESVPSSSPKSSNFDAESISDIEDGLDTKIQEFKPLQVSLEMPDSHDSMDDITSAFDRVIESQNKGYITRNHSRLVHVTWGQHDTPKRVSGQTNLALPEENATVSPLQNGSSNPAEREEQECQTSSSEPAAISDINVKERYKGDIDEHLQNDVTLASAANVSKITEEGDTRASVGIESASIGDSTSGTSIKTERKFEERGRLFVKVLSAKNLSLPIPEDRKSFFCMTLDNGLHCVTTSWLKLQKDSQINQEFELVVIKNLEFILTLQAKVEDHTFDDMNASTLNTRQKSTFSRIFTSPKRKAREESNSLMTVFGGQVAPDGSFARAYVSLESYEKLAYGRGHTAEISCFNEWAVDMEPVGSKGKRLSKSMDRKPPYKIGKIELQLFFVPIPSNAKESDLPKSLHSCTRQMRDAEWHTRVLQEGFLSQQGGDCPYWRRRFFRMVGPNMTAYHEATRQPRASINLYNAVALIDDRKTLISDCDANRKRDSSAFAEQEGGYMFVEEGFRIRFANGEVIDFYAATKEEKKAWIRVLEDTVGKIPVVKPWTQLVLEKDFRSRQSSGSQPA